MTGIRTSDSGWIDESPEDRNSQPGFV